MIEADDFTREERVSRHSLHRPATCNATEEALNDNNVLKFEPRKPKQENKPATPGPKKGLIWLAVAAVIVLAWAYYQFLAPQAL